MKTPWQVAIAQARMAHFGQRAYRDVQGEVRFYPSMAFYAASGRWFEKTMWMEEVCIERGDTRLTNEEAKAIWGTRPKGME